MATIRFPSIQMLDLAKELQISQPSFLFMGKLYYLIALIPVLQDYCASCRATLDTLGEIE